MKKERELVEIKKRELAEMKTKPLINRNSKRLAPEQCPLYMRLDDIQAQRKEKISKAISEKECLEKSTMAGWKVSKGSAKRNPHSGRSSIDFSQSWSKEREEKVHRARMELEFEAYKDATFQPKLCQHSRKLSAGCKSGVYERNEEFLEKKH